jgi:hypothetical protein
MLRIPVRAATAAASLLAVLGAVAAGPAPALAESATIADPAGDAAGHGLDVTGARLRNLDHRIVVDVTFVRDVRGDLIVSIDRRHGQGLRLVSEHDPAGHTDDLVIRHAFSDASVGDNRPVRCRGFRVSWSDARAAARLVLPQRCLHGGDYGAVRFAVLTERRSDTDYAPEGRSASGWISRG